MEFCESNQNKIEAIFTDPKYLQMQLIEKLNDAHVVEEPFPHIFINNFLPNDLRDLLINSVSELEFRKYYEGAVPVFHLTEKSPEALLFFKKYILDDLLTPFFKSIFNDSDFKKNIELNKTFENIIKLDKAEYGSIYFAKNPAGGKIKMHVDDNFASFQYVFYFGYKDGCAAPTTDLLLYPQLNIDDDSTDLNSKNYFNYGPTNNGLLVFVNTPSSYHGLLSPLNKERLTLCISAHYHHKNT
jgi:hypothetical protein